MINILFSQEYKNHDTGNHPESIKRIEVVNNLIKKIKLINTYLGSDKKKPTREEIDSGNIHTFRRSLYLNKDIKKNSIIRKEDLVSLRPAKSLSAKYFFKII